MTPEPAATAALGDRSAKPRQSAEHVSAAALARGSGPVPRAANAPSSARVAILLSSHNGERFLTDQLASLLTQTHPTWHLYWRDDGSADGSAALLRVFGAGSGAGRVTEVQGPRARLGAARSFFALLSRLPPADVLAFADQDDVWLPDKLARGVAALARVPADVPALYCARQTLVDANLRRMGLSFRLHRPPGFPAALAQNIATGCTAMMNNAAARLIARSHPPPGTLHDWWSYLIVAAAGGAIIADAEPAVFYRQHDANLIGARGAWLTRAVAALCRGPRPFMRVFRAHVAALAAAPESLSPEAARALAVTAKALAAPPWRRLPALALPGLRRQTILETLLFRIWFLLG